VLLGGRVVEGRGLGAEFHVDGFTGNLIGPFEVTAGQISGATERLSAKSVGPMRG
jgi:hypothetical protein